MKISKNIYQDLVATKIDFNKSYADQEQTINELYSLYYTRKYFEKESFTIESKEEHTEVLHLADLLFVSQLINNQTNT